jgi:hypothetical protein
MFDEKFYSNTVINAEESIRRAETTIVLHCAREWRKMTYPRNIPTAKSHSQAMPQPNYYF